MTIKVRFHTPNEFKNNAATKHIDVAYHLSRDYAEQGYTQISYVPTSIMVADGMTKALKKDKLNSNLEMYGLFDTSTLN